MAEPGDHYNTRAERDAIALLVYWKNRLWVMLSLTTALVLVKAARLPTRTVIDSNSLERRY